MESLDKTRTKSPLLPRHKSNHTLSQNSQTSSLSSRQSPAEELEIARAEQQRLKHRLESRFRQNKDLKKTLYRLSHQLSMSSKTAPKQTLLPNAPFPNPSSDLQDSRTSSLNTDLNSAEILNPETADLQRLSIGSRLNPTNSKAPRFSAIARLEHAKKENISVNALKFAPSGNVLASGGSDGVIQLWRTESDRALRSTPLEYHLDGISCVSWLSDSSKIIAGSIDGTVSLWDVESTDLISHFETSKSGSIRSLVNCCTISEPWLISCGTSSGNIHIFDTRMSMSKPFKTMQNGSAVNCLRQWPPNQNILISGDQNGEIKIWDATSGKLISKKWSGNQKAIGSMSLIKGKFRSSSYFMLAANCFDGTCSVFDIEESIMEFRPIYRLKKHLCRGVSVGLSFSEFIVSSPPSELHTEIGIDDYPLNSPDSDKAASSSMVTLLASGSRDGKIFIYSIRPPASSSTEPTNFKSQKGPSQSSISSSDPDARLYQVLESNSGRIHSVSFHPSNAILATGSSNSKINLWAA